MANISETLRVLRLPGTTVAQVIDQAQQVDIAPLAPQVREVAQWLKATVPGRINNPTPAQRTALDRIELFTTRRTPLRFLGCDRQLIALELVVRVMRPLSIDQSARNLCGPNSMMHDVARRRPDDYARVAIELAESGRTRLGTLNITAGWRLLRHTWTAQSGIRQSDYIVLGSVRSSSNIFGYGLGNISSDEQIAGATRPKTLCDWLTGAGYTNVRDQTITTAMIAGTQHAWAGGGDNRRGHTSARPANLQLAAQAFTAGNLVILLTSKEMQRVLPGTVLNLPVTNSPVPFLVPSERHYVFVQNLAIGAGRVQLTIFSQGLETSTHGPGLPEAEFFPHYFGFISASP